MSKKDEALKMALELLKAAYVPADLDEQRERTIKELEALAEQPAQGCEFCSHPLYAGTKCKNCGREQPAQRKPLTDEQIDRAIAELGLNYFADAANNRAVLRELCRKAAHGIKEKNT